MLEISKEDDLFISCYENDFLHVFNKKEINIRKDNRIVSDDISIMIKLVKESFNNKKKEFDDILNDINLYDNYNYLDYSNDKYYLLSLEYYYKTELHDKYICSNTNEYGEAIPANSYERKKINDNAKYYYNKLLKDLPDKDKIEYYKNYFTKLKFNRIENEYKLMKNKINNLLKKLHLGE
jgi:hypothetical protein